VGLEAGFASGREELGKSANVVECRSAITIVKGVSMILIESIVIEVRIVADVATAESGRG